MGSDDASSSKESTFVMMVSKNSLFVWSSFKSDEIASFFSFVILSSKTIYSAGKISSWIYK